MQRGARRATCIIHCHRHIRAPPASWDRKISHQRHPSTARLRPLQGPAGRAAYCPQQQRRLLFSRASHHVSSHHSAALNCAPSCPRPRPRLILRSRYAAQGRIVLEVLPCPLPSHRLAKRNACGTKRYGLVACQPVPTACRSSNAWPSFTLAHRRSPGQPWDSRARVDRPAGAGGPPLPPTDRIRCPGFLISLQMTSARELPSCKSRSDLHCEGHRCSRPAQVGYATPNPPRAVSLHQ